MPAVSAVLRAGGLLLASFALVGCPTIPASSVRLSDSLAAAQKQLVQDVRILTAAYRELVDAEVYRVTEPVDEVAARLAGQVELLDALIGVVTDPGAPLGEEWDDDPDVNAFLENLEQGNALVARWRPWLTKVAADRELLFVEATIPLRTDNAKLKSDLEDGNSILRKIVQPYLDGNLRGKDLPAYERGVSLNSALRADWSTFETLADANDAPPVLVSLQDLILTISRVGIEVSRLEARLGAAGRELGDARRAVFKTRAAILERRQALVAAANEVRSRLDRNLSILESNADEIANGNAALADALRRSVDAYYRVKEQLFSGTKTITSSLESLGVIDDQQLARFNDKADEYESKIDEIASRDFQLARPQ